ncbi:hypothetical protein ACEPAG_4646 [Sanghuangporus baumii]
MTVTDEETPLLHNSVQEDDELPVRERERERAKETPIPWSASSCLLVRLASCSCYFFFFWVIYPFVPQLIRETGVTKRDDKKAAYYVGIMHILYKPGYDSSALVSHIRSCRSSSPALVIARSLNGALKGNIGVVKSMMGEMTDATNVARAFTYQPISWSTGATIGPLIGRALSHPTERFPALFGESSFLKSHPYFLPCSIPATYSIL